MATPPKRIRAQKNLTLDPRIIALAGVHVSQNRKLQSFSNYMETLLVRDLRKKGIKLPPEFATV